MDCSKIKGKLNWEPVWNIEQAVEKTVEFAKIQEANENCSNCMEMQVLEYVKMLKIY